ncbi:MAG: tetratricopeptide repeat protein, partial [Gammaproteobacteria bacterium]|nr:tetratricopeptide repeat protein [Gammaproteobacteria bacterium]
MKIISFFSFKGGVGRTALLSNLGAHWAAQGKVVALMDLDLSAPGLSYSLPSKPLYEEGRGRGIGDLLGFSFDKMREDPNNIELSSPSRLLRQVEGERLQAANGNLFSIEAGHYHAAPVQMEDAQEAIAAIPGDQQAGESLPQTAARALAYYLRQDLAQWTVPEGKAKGRPIDYLLIDSRTGFAELIDLSLGYLADKMVLVSGLNRQNLRGLEYTLDALKTERVPLDTFPTLVSLVFSPLPAGEDESLFHALEEAHRLVQSTLRFTRAGQREQSPRIFSLHYTPILATRESLLVLERPKSLYAREVFTIAHHLEGRISSDKEDIQDEFLQETRRAAMRLIAPQPATMPAAEKTVVPEGPVASNPLADLPPWYWPLPKAEQQNVEARQARLKQLMPDNPKLKLEREFFVNQLSWSASLTKEEKGRIMAALPRLEQGQVDRLLELFEEERRKFMGIWVDQPEQRDALLVSYFNFQHQWASLIINDEAQVNERFLLAPLQGEFLFPHWEEWPEYWLLLAKDLFIRMQDEENGFAAVARALAIEKDETKIGERLLELAEPAAIPTSALLQSIEKRAQALAPDSSWVNFLQARNRLQALPPDREAARELLLPVLDNPPDDGQRCFRIAAFVLDNLPEIADQAEAVIRKAVALEPRSAVAWNTLGNLLTIHLNRYEEAEAAYRKSIELDEKFAYPWNSLGNLLTEHLNCYEEAEAAYRKAIELDGKLAYPWNGLGNVLTEHLNRYEEAEAAYRKAIELDEKLAYPWNGLGNLLQYHLNRY